MLLNQKVREGKWENWLAKIQEYDIEIKPLKVVKGQELCKLMARIDAVNEYIYISPGSSLLTSKWYKNIIFYLSSG
jgi:hypothetical protein